MFPVGAGQERGAVVAEPALRGDEVGGAAPRKGGVSPGDGYLAFRLGALLGELRRLHRAGEGHLRREIPAGATEDLAAEVQGAAVGLEREGAVQREQRPVVLAQAVGGVSRLVPHHREVGIRGRPPARGPRDPRGSARAPPGRRP